MKGEWDPIQATDLPHPNYVCVHLSTYHHGRVWGPDLPIQNFVPCWVGFQSLQIIMSPFQRQVDPKKKKKAKFGIDFAA